MTPDRSALRVVWVAAALVAAASLADVAVGLFTDLTDAGCDALFSECIRARQQYLRGALGVLAVVLAAGSVVAAVRLGRGRPGRGRALIALALVTAAAFAVVQPESHLDSRTEWLGP